MRTPSINDLSAHTLCNLPASVKRLPPKGAQPAIGNVKLSRFSDSIDESPNQTDAAICISNARASYRVSKNFWCSKDRMSCDFMQVLDEENANFYFWRKLSLRKFAYVVFFYFL